MAKIESLTDIELKLLNELSNKFLNLEEITVLDKTNLFRASSLLESKGLLEKKDLDYELVDLGVNGSSYKKILLPEVRLYNSLSSSKEPVSKLLKKSNLDEEELKVSIGLLKKLGLISISKDSELEIARIKDDFKFEAQEFLNNKFPIRKENVQEGLLKELLKRKDIIEITKVKKVDVKLTSNGLKLKEKAKNYDFSKIKDSLTQSMLKSGSWKDYTFRHVDLNQKTIIKSKGRKHPLQAIIKYIRDICLELGFKEMQGNWVESSFWCMDSMWIPQDHPARDVQDTFFLPYEGKLPEKELLKKIKEVHEDGGSSNSKGYGSKWDLVIAKQLIMRTHTTASTYRYFHKENIKDMNSCKYFSIGRVFRNEASDATHLSEFHQVEGFVMGDNLNLRHLMGMIKMFFNKLGIDKVKFKLSYNPYTEPSLEAFYYDENLGWLELINSGIFRPESLYPYGIKKPVIAWGIGLERLAMLLYKKDKLKELVGPEVDLEWIKNYTRVLRK